MQTERTSRPPIAEIIFGHTREKWLKHLNDYHPHFEWHIGRRRFGDPHFRSEHPAAEIVSFWQPLHGKRDEKYAIYARRRDA